MSDRTVYNTPLTEQPTEYWLNSILARLAVANGTKTTGSSWAVTSQDVEDLVTQVEEKLWQLEELKK